MTIPEQQLETDLRLQMRRIGQSARAAAAVLARTPTRAKDLALDRAAAALRAAGPLAR